MDWLGAFNLIEAGWWLFVAAVVAVQSRHTDARRKRLGFATAMCLVAFGISDGIEFFTGAWWRPWPLLVLKAACLSGLVAIGMRWLRLRESRVDQTNRQPQDDASA